MRKRTKKITWMTLVVVTSLLFPLNQLKSTDEEAAQAGQKDTQQADTKTDQGAAGAPLEEFIIDPKDLTIQIESMFPNFDEIPPELEEENKDACNACLRKFMDARWNLRQKCLADGGSEEACDGMGVDETCCQCRESPDANPNCWQACDPSCQWTEQCETECGWGEDVKPEEGAAE